MVRIDYQADGVMTDRCIGSVMLAFLLAGCGGHADYPAGIRHRAERLDCVVGVNGKSVPAEELSEACRRDASADGQLSTRGLPVRPGLEAARRTVVSSGCTACHRLGDAGNDGPGPDLTAVGDRLAPKSLRRVLESPPAPMPSYRGLSRETMRALVAYLASLRTRTP